LGREVTTSSNHPGDAPATGASKRIHVPIRPVSLPIVVYPIATPVAAILYLGASVASHPMWLIRPLLVVVAIGLVITVSATALTRDRHRAGIAAWAVIVGLLVDEALASVVLWGLALVVLVTGFAIRREPWTRGPRITSAMTVFALALLAATVLRGVQTGILQADLAEIVSGGPHAGPGTSREERSPDIFVLLLDAYPGSSAQRLDQAGGTALVPDLEDRGFDVAANSRSNYLLTSLSLPALFGARHLVDMDGLATSKGSVQDARALRQATDAGVVLSELGARGYERIAIASGYSELGPIGVDRLIIPPQINELEAAILTTSGAGMLVGLASPAYLASDVRSRVVDSLDAAVALAKEPHDRPRFAFVHIPAPHAPWATDRAGQLIVGKFEFVASPTESGDRNGPRARQFYDYAAWVGAETTRAIDRILEASSSPPIVIVASDHGPDYDFNTRSPLTSDLDLRSSNLMAVRVPTGLDVLPDDATLVNLFPYVLNAELNLDLPLQPDTIWAWKSNSSILDYVEIDPATWAAK
jgi:hypothetical protein